MANYATLKAAIQAVIKTNGNNEITGALLQQSLLVMINSLGAGYQYVGIATPDTNPGTPDQNVFYLASTAGTYANFGGLVLADGEVAILKYNGAWSKDSTGAASLEKVNQLGQNAVLYPNLMRSDIQYYKKYIKKGSIYNGIINGSNDCLYIDKYFYCKNVRYLLCNSEPRIRVTFYDANKNYTSNTGGYAIVNCINIPNDACWYRVSMEYDGYSSENPISPNDYTDGDFYVKNLVLYTDNLPKCDSDHLITSGAVEKVAGSDIDISSLLATGYDDTRTWITTMSNYKGVCIECSDGDRFIITAGENPLLYSFLTSVPLTDTSPVPRVEGTTRVEMTAGETKYIVIPTGTKYLYISTHYGNTDSTPTKVIRCAKFLGVIDNCDMDSAGYPLSARQGLMLNIKPNNYINIKYLAIGSYYQNWLDTRAKKYISTRDRFYFVRPLKRVSFRAKLGNTPYTTRVSFYDDSHTFLSQTDYSAVSFVDVPANATYCKFSFDFSERDTDIDLNELVQGNFATNAIEEDYQSEYNNGSKLLLPISKGYINFDNTAKKITVNGQIGILYGHSMKYVESGIEIQYPNNLTPSSGTYFYLVYDGVQFSIRIANDLYYNIIEIEKAAIVACIWIDSERTIRRDNISFCVIPFKIDGDIDIDYSILKTYSSYFNVENAVDSFLFFTDPHIFNNGFVELKDNKYIKAIKDYYEATPTSHCICGGDWMNHFDDDGEAVKVLGYVDGYMNENFKHYIPIVGNHDYNKYQAGHTKLGNQSLINLWYRNIGKTYFYIENKATDSRFYFFDSGIDNDYSTMDAHKWGQVNWFATELLNNVSHNIIFVHISHINDYLIPFVDNLTALANAYNNRTTITLNAVTYDFSGCFGSVHCVISGHKHEDDIYTANSIPVVITADLRNSNIPTFDLGVVDYTAKKLYMVRVGSGSSREINII